MISGGKDANQFAQIRLILEANFVDNPEGKTCSRLTIKRED